jgi:hypothetical protein
VWWFTDGAIHYAKVRNTNLNTPGNAYGFIVMPGANPPGSEDTPNTVLLENSPKKTHYYGKHLNLCHFGSLAKDRSLSIILRAAHRLFEQYPEARQQLRVNAYGAPLDALSIAAIHD